uniref:Uncharacterized protein n=1 Tax=Arundo donax TaxID=35708 RepID=A0A0A9DGA0_ARUDO
MAMTKTGKTLLVTYRGFSISICWHRITKWMHTLTISYSFVQNMSVKLDTMV